jgi:hypothetical protein
MPIPRHWLRRYGLGRLLRPRAGATVSSCRFRSDTAAERLANEPITISSFMFSLLDSASIRRICASVGRERWIVMRRNRSPNLAITPQSLIAAPPIQAEFTFWSSRSQHSEGRVRRVYLPAAEEIASLLA